MFCEQTVQWSSSGLCAFTTLFSTLMSVRARQHQSFNMVTASDEGVQMWVLIQVHT